MKPLTIANHYLVAAIEGALRQGMPIEEIFRGTGIPPERVNQPMARVSGEQFAALIQRLWTILDDEYMGFGTAKCTPGMYATLCQLCIHAPNLEVMFKRAARFYSLFEQGPRLALQVDQGVASVSIENNTELFANDPHHFMQESLLVIWHRTACWMADQRINLIGADFAYPEPDHAQEYRSIFYCPSKFDAPQTTLHFSANALSYPIKQNERTLKEFLKTSPADLLARPTKDESFNGRIRHIIGRDIQGELPSFEQVADLLHMTPQTLRRRLKSEKTSYQELKDNIRRDIAIYHLGQSDLGVNEIALKVGFTEPSTFHRAFKKWTGVTPTAYREEVTVDK